MDIRYIDGYQMHYTLKNRLHGSGSLLLWKVTELLQQTIDFHTHKFQHEAEQKCRNSNYLNEIIPYSITISLFENILWEQL